MITLAPLAQGDRGGGGGGGRGREKDERVIVKSRHGFEVAKDGDERRPSLESHECAHAHASMSKNQDCFLPKKESNSLAVARPWLSRKRPWGGEGEAHSWAEPLRRRQRSERPTYSSPLNMDIVHGIHPTTHTLNPHKRL